MQIRMPVPPGELIDRITILRVKRLYIRDKKKVANVKLHLQALRKARASLPQSIALKKLEARLLAVNKAQWHIEDTIRTALKKKELSTLATFTKKLHTSNNMRAALKRRIDTLLRSDIFDEKQYA